MGCIQAKRTNYAFEFLSSKSQLKNSCEQRVATSTTSPITRSKSTMNMFMTNKERANLLTCESMAMSSKLLLSPPFSNFSCFSSKIYLTGIGGLTLDNLKSYHIKCLINVADEVPQLNLNCTNPSITCYKYSISESYNFQIYEYFDKVGEQISHSLRANDGNVVVYCVSGMSRSATIVLAYAIKYMKTSLKEAFQRLQEVRPYARPNLNFFHQLVLYERECLGSNSVQMVMEPVRTSLCNSPTNSDKVKSKSSVNLDQNYLSIPDFYRKEYPHLFKLEMVEAKKNNCLSVPVIQSTNNFNNLIVNGTNGEGSMKNTDKLAGSRSKLDKRTSSSSSGCNNKQPPQPPNNSSGGAVDVEQKQQSTNELKPFIVEDVCYVAFLAEYDQVKSTGKYRIFSPNDSKTRLLK